MSFLRDFGGGFARQLTADLVSERDRMNKLADEETSIATRQRLAKKAEREAEKKVAEETSGLLLSLGYDEDAVQSILSKGKLSANFWATAGQDALKKGVDPNTLINMPSISSDLNEQDKEEFTSTVAASTSKDAVPVGMGDISEGATLKAIADIEVADGDSVTIADGFTLNKDAFSRLYGTPDKVEASFGARLAVLSQKISRKPNDPSMEAWKSEQQQLLNDLAQMKTAERDKTGDVTPSFDLGTIVSNVNEIRRGSLSRFGFNVGIDGEITNMTEGKRQLADIAEMNVAGQLMTRNKGINDKSMEYTAEGIRNAAIANLTDYGYNVYNNNKEQLLTANDNTTFIEGVKTGQYKPGQVITVGTKVIIYTGIPDYKTQQPFVILNPKDVDM